MEATTMNLKSSSSEQSGESDPTDKAGTTRDVSISGVDVSVASGTNTSSDKELLQRNTTGNESSSKEDYLPAEGAVGMSSKADIAQESESEESDEEDYEEYKRKRRNDIRPTLKDELVQQEISIVTYGCANAPDPDAELRPPGPEDVVDALKERDIDLVYDLIERGADVNAEFERRSILYYAVGMNSPHALSAVKRLLEQGAVIKPAACEYTKISCPLHFAAYLNKLDIFKLLLDIVGDANMIDREGCAPLHAAAKGNSMDVIRYLFEEKGAKANIEALDRSTPLHMGAVRGHINVVRYLVERGAKVNFSQSDGTSALILAACRGSVPVTEYLLQKGANINKCDKEGWTALHSASCYNYPAVMDVLLAKGADVNALSREDETAVMAASQADRPKPIIKLFKAGCDINRVNKRGNSPLFESCSRYHTHSTWALLDCGVDINTPRNIKSFSEAVVGMKLHEKIDLKDVIKMMLEGGAILQAEWLMTLGNAYIVHHCISLNRLYKHLTIPRTLQSCCRNVIRANIRKPISENLDLLDLPAKVQHEISLRVYIERNRPSSWRWGGERELYEQDF